MSKNIIIISTFFPPNRHIAVSRVETYAKYLSVEHQVTVITLGDREAVVDYEFENGTKCKVYYLSNKSLLTPLLFYTGKEGWFTHKFKTVVRVIHNKFDISLFSNWAKKAENLLSEILKEKKVDVLISSYAPEDVLEVSYKALHKLDNTHTKWVLDMRDEYSDELGLSNKIKLKRQENETDFSKRADLVLSVSEPLVDLFKKRMSYAKEFMELRNGFDHDIKPFPYIKKERLRIGYFGSLHGEAKPNILFQAITELGFEEKLEIIFAVKLKTFTYPPGLNQVVRFIDYSPYIESIKKMSEMDVNLLILPSKIRVGVYSGKIFDYLSSGRPILALVNPDDVAAKLIYETDSGYVTDFEDVEQVKESILKLYNDWQHDTLKQPSADQIFMQHRKFQVEKLNNWINTW